MHTWYPKYVLKNIIKPVNAISYVLIIIVIGYDKAFSLSNYGINQTLNQLEKLYIHVNRDKLI